MDAGLASTRVDNATPAGSLAFAQGSTGWTRELLLAFREVLTRAEMFSHHHIQREPLSVRERMSLVLSALTYEKFTDFTSLFTVEEGRMGVVVTFLAVLELIKESLVELVQNEPFAPIHVRSRTE